MKMLIASDIHGSASRCRDLLAAWDREADEGRWEAVESPVIDQPHFAATGTRFLEDNGRDAIQDLFKRSFKR